MERRCRSGNSGRPLGPLAESLFVLGHDDEAQHWVERALELGDDDDAITQAQARGVRALLHARRGEPEAARRDVEDVLRITAGMQAPQAQGQAALNAASVFSILGDAAAAEEQLKRALDLFTAKGSVLYAAKAREALAAMAAVPPGH